MPRTAEQIRADFRHATSVSAEKHNGPTRWDTIEMIENCWPDEPGKVKTANRRSVLRYLLGVDSTKLLPDSTMTKLNHWIGAPNGPAECRTVLRAALVEAGQLELAAYRREDMQHDAEIDADARETE